MSTKNPLKETSEGFFRLQAYQLVHRRRWRHKETGEELTRDFTFLGEGTKFTAELADFLKQRGR